MTNESIDYDFALSVVAGNVDRLIKARHLTNAQAAERIGITEKNLWRIRRGVYAPRLSTIYKIQHAFGCNWGNILGNLK